MLIAFFILKLIKIIKKIVTHKNIYLAAIIWIFYYLLIFIIMAAVMVYLTIYPTMRVVTYFVQLFIKCSQKTCTLLPSLSN